MIDDSADQGSADATEAIAARYINVAQLFVVDDGNADDGAGKLPHEDPPGRYVCYGGALLLYERERQALNCRQVLTNLPVARGV